MSNENILIKGSNPNSIIEYDYKKENIVNIFTFESNIFRPWGSSIQEIKRNKFLVDTNENDVIIIFNANTFMIETQFKHVINDILYQSFLPNNIVCEDINRKKIDIFDISLNKIDFVIEQETEYAKVVFIKNFGIVCISNLYFKYKALK